MVSDKPWRPFVVLVVADRRAVQQALQSVLEESGYAALAAETAQHALEMSREAQPDAVLVDSGLSDMPVLDLCRRLTSDAGLRASTPLFLLTAHGNSRRERLDAFASGVWDVCPQPIDGTALLLKLQVYLRARQSAERLREGSFVDDVTGVYNVQGLRRRADELAADARRRHEPLACIAIRPVVEGDAPQSSAATSELVAAVCARSARGSDVVGRLDTTDLAILAPATDDVGALRLVSRLQTALAAAEAGVAGRSPIGIRASYRASIDFAQSATGPMALLLDARDELG